jgi:hypothetical protein
MSLHLAQYAPPASTSPVAVRKDCDDAKEALKPINTRARATYEGEADGDSSSWRRGETTVRVFSTTREPSSSRPAPNSEISRPASRKIADVLTEVARRSSAPGYTT